jgi:predicted secreted Zn-dependent protease
VIAYTNCTIDFQYQAHPQRGYYRLDFNIRLLLNNNKSWMDKDRVTSAEMLAEILKHEQGHYTIAYMEQQELRRTVARTVFHDDYQYEARNIFDRIDAKYKQLNLDYDADTNHMRNRDQQQSWDAYFKKQLEFMPPS